MDGSGISDASLLPSLVPSQASWLHGRRGQTGPKASAFAILNVKLATRQTERTDKEDDLGEGIYY